MAVTMELFCVVNIVSKDGRPFPSFSPLLHYYYISATLVFELPGAKNTSSEMMTMIMDLGYANQHHQTHIQRMKNCFDVITMEV